MFCPSFIDIHRRLAPSVPIGRFASYVNPQAIGFNSERDFYAPVQFSVQIADGVTGALRLNVATQKNPNWMADMKEQLAKTIGVEARSASIELKTITGLPLERVPESSLNNVGKLNVYNKGELIRLASLPNVPPEYRVTKVADLHAWASKLGDSIPEAVASVLKGKDIHEVEEALRIGGAVQKAIEKKLKPKGFQSFIRLHQANSSKTPIPQEDAEKLLRKLSKQVLIYVRSFVGAANEQVKYHIAAEQAQKAKPASLNKEDEHLFKPVLVQSSPPPAGVIGHPPSNLYQTLVEDALSMLTLQKSLVASVYNFEGNQKNAAPQVIASVRPTMKRMVSPGNHHPMNAHIHHTLLPLRGTYPADYIVRHTRQDMSAKAPFVGDVQKVYEAYHKFSGAHIAPPPVRIKGGVVVSAPRKAVETNLPKLIPIESFAAQGRTLPKLIPIDCHHPSHKTHPREQRDDEYVRSKIGSEMPKLIPIDSLATPAAKGMPKLIPIDCHHRRSGSSSSDDERVNETIGSAMPPLIPIGCGHRRSKSSSDDEGVKETIGNKMPPLIPIGSAAKEMPLLIPIEGRHPHGQKGKKKSILKRSFSRERVDAQLPRLIPINAPAEPIEEEVDEYAHLPSVDDVFK